METKAGLPRCLTDPRPAVLVLADGTVFRGWAAGKPARVEGEVVFNTAMTGYQEMVTDPSYHGQILCLTTAHVGQVGINTLDAESDRTWGRALIVQDLDDAPSSWRSEEGFEQWLERMGVTVGWGFDVRAIVRRIRDHGAVPGVLDASEELDLDRAREQARQACGTDGCDLASEVACDRSYPWSDGPWQSPSHQTVSTGPGQDVVVIDLGVKRSILRRLVAEGFRVRVMPPTTTLDQLMAAKPAGVVLSNGPGDPAAVVGVRVLAEGLLGRLPLLGICLGHQILGLALGARTVKLPFGHHGGNHPVRELATGRVLITAQNHNYAVEEASLPREVEITHVNLTDGTVEGLALPRLGLAAVQFHPEAAPGPNDALALIRSFAERCRSFGQ
jgi:carbamoyl-phosphate synthase small subunit